LASGMTIKFFPLFFENQCKLSPTFVSTIYVVSPLTIAVLAWIAQKISLKIGRVQVSTMFTTIGVSLLVTMSLRSLWEHSAIIVPIFIVRTALMNATTPLVKSILMDYTSPEMRAKWSSLESVTGFGWSGSAVLGGILADNFGYGYTFVITAAMQFLSCLVLMLTLPIVRLESTKALHSTVVPAEADASESSHLGAGLLSVSDQERTVEPENAQVGM